MLLLLTTLLSALLVASPVGAVECPANYTDIEGSCFLFLNDQVAASWQAARIACQDNGGDLAIITECNVFRLVVRYIHTNGLEVPDRFSYFIGGTDAGDEGSWYWIDDTPMSMGIPFWGSAGNITEPGGGIAQNCAQLYKDDRYYFHDGECNKAGYALCQATIGTGPNASRARALNALYNLD